jgi:hypothetical protein
MISLVWPWLALFACAEYQNGNLFVAEKEHRQSQPAEAPATQAREPKQVPIHFRDAIGRKIAFPYEMVNTWPVSTKCSLIPYKIWVFIVLPWC